VRKSATYNKLVDAHVNTVVLLLLHSTLPTAALYVMPAFTVLRDEESVVILRTTVLQRYEAKVCMLSA
jgi:hypothetical protein